MSMQNRRSERRFESQRIQTLYCRVRPFVTVMVVLMSCLVSISVLGQPVDVQVTWNPNDETDLDGYRVWWGIESGSYTDSEQLESDVNDYLITGLSQTTTYYIAVTAFDTSLNESDATEVFIRPDITPPQFSNISSGTPGETSATITWNTNEPSTSQVEYGTTTAYGSESPLDASLVLSHSVTLSGLDPWTTYEFRVKSTDAYGNPGVSGNYQFQTADNTPPVITGVGHQGVGDTVATVVWTTNEAADSVVEYSEDLSYGSSVDDTSLVISHSLPLTGLDPFTTYNYRVRSTDQSGNERISSGHSFTTTDSGAPVISHVNVSDITGSGATVTWNTNEPSTSQVEYGLTTAYGQSTTKDETLTLNHTVMLTGLDDGTTYHFKVLSEDDAGNEGESGDNTFDTLDETPPDPPDNVDVDPVS